MPCRSRSSKPGDRDDRVQQRGVVDGGALRGLDVVEAGVVVVRQPAAGAELLGDLRGDLSDQADVAHDVGQVVRSVAGEEPGVDRVEVVGPLGRVVVDEAGGHHTAQPLPHVALVEPGGVGDLGAGRRWERGQGVEEAGLVAEAGEDADGAVVEDADAPARRRRRGRGRRVRSRWWSWRLLGDEGRTSRPAHLDARTPGAGAASTRCPISCAAAWGIRTTARVVATQTMPCWWAQAAAAVREETPVLRKMLAR